MSNTDKNVRFILVRKDKTYFVLSNELSIIIESDIPAFIGKNAGILWSWAKQNTAKVYNMEHLPNSLSMKLYAI